MLNLFQHTIEFMLPLQLFVELLVEFFAMIEPTLSSVAILSGFGLYLYEKFVNKPFLSPQDYVTLIAMSDKFEVEKKMHFPIELGFDTKLYLMDDNYFQSSSKFTPN